jgi:hypothetical protein
MASATLAGVSPPANVSLRPGEGRDELPIDGVARPSQFSLDFGVDEKMLTREQRGAFDVRRRPDPQSLIGMGQKLAHELRSFVARKLQATRPRRAEQLPQGVGVEIGDDQHGEGLFPDVLDDAARGRDVDDPGRCGDEVQTDGARAPHVHHEIRVFDASNAADFDVHGAHSVLLMTIIWQGWLARSGCGNGAVVRSA